LNFQLDQTDSGRTCKRLRFLTIVKVGQLQRKALKAVKYAGFVGNMIVFCRTEDLLLNQAMICTSQTNM